MDKEKTMKIVGFACAFVGFGVSMVAKNIEDRKLGSLVEKEVRKQLDDK